jgi:hypothetical protein
VVRVNPVTGEMTGYDNWPNNAVPTNPKFIGGVYDGQNIWMIPSGSISVIKLSGITTIPIYTADQLQAMGSRK